MADEKVKGLLEYPWQIVAPPLHLIMAYLQFHAHGRRMKNGAEMSPRDGIK